MNTVIKDIFMGEAKSAFSGFSVTDLAKAKEFYAQTLGLEVAEEGVGLKLHLKPDLLVISG